MRFQFTTLSFQAFTPQQLYAYLQLRSEVFVVEQNCVYQDLDNLDQESLHLLVYDAHLLVACARIVAANEKYPNISIGRVIVAATHRKQDLGHALMRQCIKVIEERFGTQKIVLSAQAHLQNFYKKHNFAPQGAIYLEDGIPHIHMERMQ
jgi:ElaA protein